MGGLIGVIGYFRTDVFDWGSWTELETREVIRTLALIVGGSLAGFATLVFTSIRTLAHHAQAEAQALQAGVAEQGHITDRFSKAIDHLSDTSLIRPVAIHRAPGVPVDFEDYDGIAASFRSAIALARDRCGARLSEICVDATAGPKIFSIAAAVVTLNQSLVFTYVNNQGKVRAFDASVSMGEFA